MRPAGRRQPLVQLPGIGLRAVEAYVERTDAARGEPGLHGAGDRAERGPPGLDRPVRRSLLVTIAPRTTSLWPDSSLDAECTTKSAPSSSGR